MTWILPNTAFTLEPAGRPLKYSILKAAGHDPPHCNDLYQLARLVDALDNIHFFLRPCIPTDIPENDYDANVFYACLNATGKHVMAGVNDVAGFHKALDIAAMVAGDMAKLKDKPFISIITSFAISPLKLCTQSTLIMQEAVRNRIPVALSSAPMAGSTSPLTMAGHSGSAPRRAACRNCRLPVNQPRRTDLIWRDTRHGKS